MPFVVHAHRIDYLQGGQLLAQVLYPPHTPGTVNVARLWVHPALRGLGVKNQLMERCATQLRQTGRAGVVTCGQGKAWLRRHPAARDVLR